MIGALRRQPCEDRDIQGNCEGKVKAKIGVVQPQAKKHQRLPENQKLEGVSKDPLQVSEGTWPANTLISGF